GEQPVEFSASSPYSTQDDFYPRRPKREATQPNPSPARRLVGPPRALPQPMIFRCATFALSSVLLHATVVPIDPMEVTNPAQPHLVDGAKGAGVVRAQILLARAHFSCGEIDGIFGSNFRKALNAFQGERKLPVTGTLDAATWNLLNADSAPALINYTL